MKATPPARQKASPKGPRRDRKKSKSDPNKPKRRKVRTAWPTINYKRLWTGDHRDEVDARFRNELGDEEGRRRYFITREDAAIFAEQMAAERKNRGREVLGLTGQQQQQALRALSLIKDHKLDVSLDEAVKGYIRHIAKTEQPLPIAELVQRFLQYKRNNPSRELSKRHIDDLRQCLDVFVSGRSAVSDAKGYLKEIQGLGDRMAHEIGHREIESWLMALPHGRTTRSKYRTHLSSLFRYALNNGVIGTNPIDRVAKMGIEEPPKGILTPDQTRRLLANADPSIVPALALCSFAGLRPESDTCRLDWSDIHLLKETITDHAGNKVKSYGHVDIRKSKGPGAERLVSITENLYEWLKRTRPASGSGPVFASYDRLNELIKAAAKSAGITHWPHDGMRHSFCSYHFAAFRNEALTMALSGHRCVTTFRRHYCRPIPQKVAFEFWKITPPKGASNIIPIAIEVAA